MPSTHTSLHFHIVFSTKERLPIISNDWRERLHAYLGGIVKGLEGVPLAVGGVDDHVHLLVGLKTSHRIDYLLRDVKADSSEWIHQEIGNTKFAWQKGYGAFTVSPSSIEGVRRYVLNQAEHHRRKTFQEEYVELLKLPESNTMNDICGNTYLSHLQRGIHKTTLFPDVPHLATFWNALSAQVLKTS